MKKTFFAIIFCSLVCTISRFAQTEADREAIKRTALNYAEGWYEGNAEKMESALHPNLAKRIARTNKEGQSRLDELSAMGLVQGTRAGFGKKLPKKKNKKMLRFSTFSRMRQQSNSKCAIGLTICTSLDLTASG